MLDKKINKKPIITILGEDEPIDFEWEKKLREDNEKFWLELRTT